MDMFAYALAKKSVGGGSQSDWNTNDNTSLSYIKNRPFYSEKVESDVWEFELPVINENTGEGFYPTIPMPNADFSQFTDKQELNFYTTAKTVSGDTHLTEGILYFCKNVNIRAYFEGVEIDTDVPETLPCICSINKHTPTEEERYSPELVFGISIEYDIVNKTASIHYTPSYATTVDFGSTFDNYLYPVQVHFENFRNKVEKVYKIPEKYLKQTENKKWKYEYKMEPNPFENQPTVAKGNVTKLKPNSFYFVELSQSTPTFKLCYGAKSNGTPIYVDDTLEFNLNNAWDTSSTEFYIIHCISVDTKTNKTIFGKAMDNRELDYIIPNGTKNIKFSADMRTMNRNLETSIIPKQDDGYDIPGFFFSFSGESFSDNYDCNSYVTKPVILQNSNTVTIVESIGKNMLGTIDNTLYELPFCPNGRESSTNVPYYNGLTHYEFELKVSNDRRSLVGNGNVSGICWEQISAIKQATPVDISSIQISYPINYYFRLDDTEKKLLFAASEGNLVTGLVIIQMNNLVGSSIIIEGEIE